MIEVRALAKSYGSTPALRGISTTIRSGEIVGLLGPNGAGKTTAMKILTGYLIPSSGSATIAGFDVVEQPREAQAKVGYLPENAPLYHDMLAQDYLAFVGAMRGMSRDAIRAGMSRAIVRCGIREVQTRPIGELSKGYRQRVGIAAAILHEPEILILDEPTNGLDPNQIVEMRNLVRTLGEEKTVIVSTHILSEVEATCRRAIILIDGAIRADAPLGEMTRSRSVALTIDRAPEEGALAAFGAIEGVRSATRKGTDAGPLTLLLELSDERDVRQAVWEIARANDWPILELHQREESLEQVFRELTSAGREAAS